MPPRAARGSIPPGTLPTRAAPDATSASGEFSAASDLALLVRVARDQPPVPARPAPPAAAPPSGPAPTGPACDLSTTCPSCGAQMQPEHAHYRCGRCGYRDSCCF